MNLKKQDIYDFILDKQREVHAEKVTPLKITYQELRAKHRSDLMKKSGITEDNYMQSVKKVKATLEVLRDNLDYHNYNLNSLINSLGDSEGNIESFLGHSINYDKIIEVREAQSKYLDTEKEIDEEFSKIKSAVKSVSSGKQGYILLKNLGFDVSSIEPAQKNEIMALKVNNALLGLPETVGV